MQMSACLNGITDLVSLERKGSLCMKVQVLVSAMNQDAGKLAEKMNLSSDAIIINQCDRRDYEEFTFRGREVKCYSFPERGVGKSRNNALMRADRDICLFSDEDIVYEDGYEEKIVAEFERNPQADMIVFNVEVEESRRTYHIEERSRVRFYNCGRYGAVSFAFRTEKLRESGVQFSLLFGGGAKYSNGEDSLFIKEFMDKGYQVYTAPITIGKEIDTGESTWFSGYHDKFFFDRGVLYTFLYGWLAKAMALRFLLAHKDTMCKEKTVKEAYSLMKKGIAQGKKELRSVRQ